MRRALLGLALGLCLVVRSPTASAVNLRVVTFNAGMGKLLHLRSQSTLRGVFTEDPRVGMAHVLALQELCLNQQGDLSTFIDLMRHNHGVQYHFASYAGSRATPCGKGQAVVSAYPIVDAVTLARKPICLITPAR